MREQGGINTVCINTHVPSYYGRSNPKEGGKPLTASYIPYDDANFEGTSLRFLREDPDHFAYAERDVLEEVIAPAHERGMKVYPRLLEGFDSLRIDAGWPGFAKVRQVDIYGELKSASCWNHPEYRACWFGYVRDILARYPVDGLYLGTERDGPFGPLFNSGSAPTCFCEHCRAKGRERGIDPERAREGMTKLHQLMIDPDQAVDGMLTTILRLWMEYPETLAWEKLQADSKFSLFRDVYRFAKSKRPDAQVGWFLPYYFNSHDWFNRAANDYSEIARYADFIKPNIYFDVQAARFNNTIPHLRKHYLRDFSSDAEAAAFVSTLMGWNMEDYPSFEEANHSPAPPSYVYDETRRLVRNLKGIDCAPYSGIGVDIPHQEIDNQPGWYHDAALAAFEAGADGLLYSREYKYMTDASLNAARDGVRAWLASKN
ncbi:MAG: hypothetical protein ACLFVC_01765 [Opitutales bacterium]